MRHRRLYFLLGKIRAQKAVGFREPATDVTLKTDGAGHYLRQWLRNDLRLFGLHCKKIH